MSGNGRLIQPNSVNVSTTYVDGPLANPSSLAMQGPGGAQILVMGGLTKVEQLAGQIAAGMTSAGSDGPEYESLASLAVTYAEAILAECARRRTPEKTE